MYQYSTGGMDVMFQPVLMADVLAPFGGKSNTLFAGIEWYLHSYVLFDGAPRHTGLGSPGHGAVEHPLIAA